MLSPSSSASMSLVGAFLRDSGYDVAHLGYELGLENGLFANHENLDFLLERTSGDSRIAVLARLFFVSWPVAESRCRAVLSSEFIEAAFACQLLSNDSDGLVSPACIVPFRSQLICCDSARLRVTRADIVTGPSASTMYPARLAVGGSDESTLDLGTGSGALALEAARYSRRVVGTDINERALQFAEFNAVLNGIRNAEWRHGDAFDPVAGEQFSRIVANPPFFLSPQQAFTYCDSPMELDGFTARLTRECSAYLKEGGYYQMVCEWVELENEPWEQRLRNWTADSGCDVLVLVSPQSSTPLSYAEKRTKEARLMRAQGADGHFAHQLQYLLDHKVTQVMTGVINMRKRSGGKNWLTIVRTDPVGADVGPDVRARFDALTFLFQNDERTLLKNRFQLAPDVHLSMRASADFGAIGWKTTLLELAKEAGLTDRLRLDEVVSRFLPLFDGARTLAEIAALVGQGSQVGEEEARRRCLELTRRLLQSNFLVPEAVSEAT